jgi:pyrroloquinoline quinone (PQQ) biosynthesis protein C
MSFFDRLQSETEQQRAELFSAPIIARALKGDVNVDEYIAFLSQAYHHVKHTVPLLMATGSRLPESQEWLRVAVGEYIEEETGHQEWVLNDIAACGADKEKVRRSKPNMATELMVSYAYDSINRINPLGFFGMVHVLEGTSISLADSAADTIRGALGLPKKAFSYLYSHGSLDQDHVEFFKGLMNRIDQPADQEQIIHSAKVFYKLYGDVFRSLDSSGTARKKNNES